MQLQARLHDICGSDMLASSKRGAAAKPRQGPCQQAARFARNQLPQGLFIRHRVVYGYPSSIDMHGPSDFRFLVCGNGENKE